MNAMSRNRGFTLIELLVVVVIIATLAGMATLSLGGSGSRHWAGEVQRFGNLLQLVSDRALIDKSHYGVVIESDGYKVVRFDSRAMRWNEVDFSANPAAASARRFTSHQLPPNMRLEVLTQTELPGAQEAEFGSKSSSRSGSDSKESDKDSGKDSGKDKEKLLPQFAALSSGEILPVEIAMYMLVDQEIGRSALISYSSLRGMQVEWQSDDL